MFELHFSCCRWRIAQRTSVQQTPQSRRQEVFRLLRKTCALTYVLLYLCKAPYLLYTFKKHVISGAGCYPHSSCVWSKCVFVRSLVHRRTRTSHDVVSSINPYFTLLDFASCKRFLQASSKLSSFLLSDICCALQPFSAPSRKQERRQKLLPEPTRHKPYCFRQKLHFLAHVAVRDVKKL